MELTFKRGGQRKDKQINKKTSQGDKTMKKTHSNRTQWQVESGYYVGINYQAKPLRR